MGSAFISHTLKNPTPRPNTADCDWVDVDLRAVQGSMPASQGLTWAQGVRKPPHFHVPFRPYPSMGGDPVGRSKGLDEWYNCDKTCASPVALHGTLAVNMRRTPRRYASTFKSNQPARPPPDKATGGSAGPLGPGSYPIDRSGIKVKEPKRPSSAFVRPSRGRFAGVGGPRGDGGPWPDQYQRPLEAWEL